MPADGDGAHRGSAVTQADWRMPKGTLLQSAVRTAVRTVVIHCLIGGTALR